MGVYCTFPVILNRCANVGQLTPEESHAATQQPPQSAAVEFGRGPRVHRPVESGIAKWVCRHSAQEVCPWNVKFSTDATEPAFAARQVIAEKDAQTLPTELLAMSQAEFSATFRKSPEAGEARGAQAE